jgi:hypothetical protein
MKNPGPSPIPGSGMQASANQFQFDKTLFESPINIRVRAQDREDFISLLNIKLIIHAPNNSQ